MNIIYEMPPQELIDRIVGAGMRPSPTTLYTYGKNLYVPSGHPVTPDLMAHEETHMRQQGTDPAGWWNLYLNSMTFRLQQETEAYANQYAHLCKIYKDRNHRSRILMDLARILSGPIYGEMIITGDAYSMIKNKANIQN
jgi:hypothetical protein